MFLPPQVNTKRRIVLFKLFIVLLYATLHIIETARLFLLPCSHHYIPWWYYVVRWHELKLNAHIRNFVIKQLKIITSFSNFVFAKSYLSWEDLPNTHDTASLVLLTGVTQSTTPARLSFPQSCVKYHNVKRDTHCGFYISLTVTRMLTHIHTLAHNHNNLAGSKEHFYNTKEQYCRTF